MKQTCRKRHYLFLFAFHLYLSGAIAQGSLNYDGSNDYINLPSGIVNSLNGDYTIEAWIYWRGAANSIWQRIIDFGTGTNFNMFLTPCNGETNTPRFAITQTSSPGEQRITAPAALSLNTWHHIAVVITHATNTGRLFIDGVNVASNTSMTFRPASLGVTVQNYLGRSQYGPDPYYNGYIEEVRISNNVRYTSAFTPQQTNFSVDGNTIALYHFDEGSGQTINDATGNYTGVLGASAAVESSDPSWASFTALPVRWINFDGVINGNAATLNWQTAFEQNNKGFHIERSVDGITFTEIDFVHSAGNSSSSHNYYYVDHTFPGTTSWYRLKQEDIDGRFTWSKIIRVSPVLSSFNQLYWYAAGGGVVGIKLDGGSNEAYYITGMQGTVLRTGNLSGGGAMITSLAHGIYTVSVMTKNSLVITTLIVL